jgi:hypothetical protein
MTEQDKKRYEYNKKNSKLVRIYNEPYKRLEEYRDTKGLKSLTKALEALLGEVNELKNIRR